MARPRIFISSTYYDLKHLRSSLENFVESLGFDAVLSEKGNIAYIPDIALDESCYKEVGNIDIFVIIIGGRYGSEKSKTRTGTPKQFYENYDSITKQEYESALSQDIPIYILIEKSVYAEYETYRKNKGNKAIIYAHVDSVNIFHLIEKILSQSQNNPIQQFDRYADIEGWLKEQWAGLFRDLLKRMSSQKQLASLDLQVSVMAEINTTLKTYLETIISEIVPTKSESLIESETERIKNETERIEESLLQRDFYPGQNTPYSKHIYFPENCPKEAVFHFVKKNKICNQNELKERLDEVVDFVKNEDHIKNQHEIDKTIQAVKDFVDGEKISLPLKVLVGTPGMTIERLIRRFV